MYHSLVRTETAASPTAARHPSQKTSTSKGRRGLFGAAIGLLFASVAHANPYNFPGPPVIGAAGDQLPDPGRVIGKEFSHLTDRDMNGAGDPGQIVSWDGVGGVIDGVDHTAILPAVAGEIDAVAHSRDLLHEALRQDATFLMFSTGNGLSPVGTGTITTSEGEIIGRAGDISYEAPGSITKGVWASGPTIDTMTTPVDIDGLELWGPEPPGSDANRFSLESDATSGVSVWADTGLPYVSHPTIVSAVTSLLGDLPTSIEVANIDVDALMSNGVDDTFGPGDSITFSIRQIVDSTDTDGFYATGSEIFTLDVNDTGVLAGYLSHGGHDWDHAYALASMKDAATGRQFDINAIEALSVPEPSGLAIAPFAGLFLTSVLRRRAPQRTRRSQSSKRRVTRSSSKLVQQVRQNRAEIR